MKQLKSQTNVYICPGLHMCVYKIWLLLWNHKRLISILTAYITGWYKIIGNLYGLYARATGEHQ